MKSEDFIIKCKVIKEFTLKDFDKLENLVRGGYKNDYGKLHTNDIFECDKKMADYLMGENPFNETVIKILEVEPEKEMKRAIIETDPMAEELFNTKLNEIEKHKKKKKNKKSSSK